LTIDTGIFELALPEVYQNFEKCDSATPIFFIPGPSYPDILPILSFRGHSLMARVCEQGPRDF
jgi:hypothetical protein